MKKILFTFLAIFSLASISQFYKTVWAHSILRDASTLSRGTLPNARLDASSVTLQGNGTFPNALLDVSSITKAGNASCSGCSGQYTNASVTVGPNGIVTAIANGAGASAPSFQNPSTGTLNMSSYSVSNVSQLVFVSSLTPQQINLMTPVFKYAVMADTAGQVYMATSTVAGSWVPWFNPNGDVWLSTGDIFRVDFDLSGKNAFDMFVSTRMGTVISASSMVPTFNGGLGLSMNAGNSGMRFPADGLYQSPHQGASNVGMMSLDFWIYQNGGAATTRNLFSKRLAGQYEYDGSINTSDQLDVFLRTAAGANEIECLAAAGAVPVSTWTLITINFDKTAGSGSACEVMVNGALLSITPTVSAAATAAGTAPLGIGQQEDGAVSACNCIIDKFRISGQHRSLSDHTLMLKEKKGRGVPF